MKNSENIRIVLVETSHPGNIGAAARAMKTMGLSQLYLVNPNRYPSAEATARSSGAGDVLANAAVVESLPEALEGCIDVFGTSARLRSHRWPIVAPDGAAEQMVTRVEQGTIACVFGRENSGLSNDEMGYCRSLIHIPVNADYSSLNLASAVQIVAYELRQRFLADNPELASAEPELRQGESPAAAEEVERFYVHLEQTLSDLNFLDPSNPRHLMSRMRRLFNRCQLSEVETRILRGVLTAVNTKCEQETDSKGAY